MKHRKAKRLMAWGMLAFVVVSAPFAHVALVEPDDPAFVHYLLALSELALAYPSVLAIWFAEAEK